MNQTISKNYTPCREISFDWTDKKRYLIHYRKLKFYGKHGMVDEKVHGVISFEQSRWLKPYIRFNTQKRALAKIEFEKEMPKGKNCSFSCKTMENVRNRLKIKLIEKHEDAKMMKMQSKLTFNGIHKSFDNYDSYKFKHNEILLDKLKYLGFVVLD